MITRAALKRRIDLLPEESLETADRLLQSLAGLRSVLQSLSERQLRSDPAVDRAFRKFEAWARSHPSATEQPAKRPRTQEEWAAQVAAVCGTVDDETFKRGGQGTFELREPFG